jgi:hypothetical protein
MFSTEAIIVILFWISAYGLLMVVRPTTQSLCVGMWAGWLFLPQVIVDLPGLTLNKIAVVTIVTAFAAAMLPGNNRGGVRFTVLDIPLWIFLSSTCLSSISNGLGSYDGFATALKFFISFGIPWYIGKVVFSSSENRNVLIRTSILAGLVYVPFCLFEMKMAPILHTTIYGYGARGARGENLEMTALRFGLWRPSVFMTYGLQTALMMGVLSAFAFWMARTSRAAIFSGIRNWQVAGILGLTTVFCVSSGAIILTAVSWGIVGLTSIHLRRVVIASVLVVLVSYPIYRMTNIGALEIEISQLNNEADKRKASLQTRIHSEDVLLERWLTRPLLGSTAWYYHQVSESVPPDSMWILMLTKFGLLGWGSWILLLTAPVACQLLDASSGQGRDGPGFILSIAALVYACDCQFNAMDNPLYLVMAGAISLRSQTERSSGPSDSQSEKGGRKKLSRELWPRIELNASS